MQAYLDCIPCLVRQSLASVRIATDDPQIQKQVVQAALSRLAVADLDATPMELGNIVQRAVREITQSDDPYAAIKESSNADALERYPELKDIVAQAKDRLRAATKIAIAGNAIDFGVPNRLDIEETLQRIIDTPPAVDDCEEFARRANQAAKVLYLADNAGEIVFDRVLIEELPVDDITVVVKDEPFINDATAEDAQMAGFDQRVHILTAPIYPDTTEKFRQAWDHADLIIAKGQANYEAYSEAPGPLFFLLIAKCDFVAQDIGVGVGDMILRAC